MPEHTTHATGTAFVMTHESKPDRQTRSLSYIALAVTRSLGRQGIPVVRIHPSQLDLSLRSKYCTKVAVSPDLYRSEQAVVEFLLELAGRHSGRRVLFPASDDCAQFLGEHRSALESAYEICVADTDVIRLVMNKRNQYEMAQAHGVPIPETYFPETRQDIDDLASSIRNYPYIIKPLIAHSWRLESMQAVSQGRKAVLARKPQELIEAYDAMGGATTETMVQEVIGGRDEQLFTFLGYFRRDHRPLAYCVRSKIRQLPIDFGYCTMTKSCHNEVVVEQSIRLLSALKYSGICGVEFKYDSNTQEYKLIEINARAVNTIGLAPACGVDIPTIAYRDLTDQLVEPVTEWKDGVRWYRFWTDLVAVRQLRKKGGESVLSWLLSLVRGSEAVFSLDDIGPTWAYHAAAIRSRLGRKSGKSSGAVAG